MENEKASEEIEPETAEEIAERARRARAIAATTYDGHVPRQELVDFCKEIGERNRKEFDRQQALLEKEGKTMSDDKYEALMLSSASLAGSIGALRAVTQWARERVETGMPK